MKKKVHIIGAGIAGLSGLLPADERLRHRDLRATHDSRRAVHGVEA